MAIESQADADDAPTATDQATCLLIGINFLQRCAVSLSRRRFYFYYAGQKYAMR